MKPLCLCRGSYIFMSTGDIVKITLLAEEMLKAPNRNKIRYDIEECNSCGRTFLRHNGHSHTGSGGSAGFTVWCCSQPCLQWFHERKPSNKTRNIITSRQSL